MDIKEEVRRRIAELTRFAYERGCRDGAQLALAEIETIAAEDVVEELSKLPAPLQKIAETKAAKKKLAQSKRMNATKGKRNMGRRANSKDHRKPKTVVVQEVLQGLLDTNGEAHRGEVLAAAQAKNPAINKFDLNNGLRIFVRQSKVRVSSDDSAVLLPAT